MLNFFAITLKVPGEAMAMAGAIANPGYMGNILIILLAVIVSGIYGFMLDRHQMVINLFATYIGFLMANFFPVNVLNLGEWANSWWGIMVIFAATTFLTILILGWTRILRSSYVSNFFVRWYQAVITGLLYTGLLVSRVLTILPSKFLSQFSPWFLSVFISDIGSFLWLVLPVAGLLFIKGKRKLVGRPAY